MDGLGELAGETEVAMHGRRDSLRDVVSESENVPLFWHW